MNQHLCSYLDWSWTGIGLWASNPADWDWILQKYGFWTSLHVADSIVLRAWHSVARGALPTLRVVQAAEHRVMLPHYDQLTDRAKWAWPAVARLHVEFGDQCHAFLVPTDP
ncbi:hypothetical protein HAX54_041662 [Datura stramonium]|uniref:Uncharacterized protein n=1 Tax=Datura stramonium TaxID=4076 RepID=A0ABS8VZA6_DATST|nr:hypothetical protein [Datura stramonium]